MNIDIKTKVVVLSKVLQELTKDKPQKEVFELIQKIHNQTVQEIYDKTSRIPICQLSVVEQ